MAIVGLCGCGLGSVAGGGAVDEAERLEKFYIISNIFNILRRGWLYVERIQEVASLMDISYSSDSIRIFFFSKKAGQMGKSVSWSILPQFTHLI